MRKMQKIKIKKTKIKNQMRNAKIKITRIKLFLFITVFLDYLFNKIL